MIAKTLSSLWLIAFRGRQVHLQLMMNLRGGASKEDSTSLSISVTANALTVDNAVNVYFIDIKHHLKSEYYFLLIPGINKVVRIKKGINRTNNNFLNQT